MTRILVIGYAPEAVDYTDLLLPKGLDEEKVAEGIEADMRKLSAKGWDAEHLNIRADEDVRGRVLDCLAGHAFDCVVVGGGVRVTSRRVEVLETVVNAIREGAPTTPIAFNEGPDTSAEAASRVLGLA